MTRSTLLVLGLAAALAGGAAHAQHSVYIGGALIDLHTSAPALAGGPSVPSPGARLEVRDATTVGFGYAYRFTPQWSVELALGVPPRHKVMGRGVIEPFGQVASVKQNAPTVFANYHFQPIGAWQPFIGAGLNHTRFSSARTTASGNAASGGPSRISLGDSWGLAVHAGAAYEIDPRWVLLGTVAYADVQSDVKLTTQTPNGEIVRTTRIKFNPVAYTLSVGYRF